MTDNTSFIDKITRFIFGPAIPIVSEDDLQLMRELSDKLDGLARHLPASAAGAALAPSPNGLEDLSNQVAKLAKTQFKANTLQESQQVQQQEVIAHLERSLEQQSRLGLELNQQRQQAVEAARLAVLKEMLPVIDSLDAAFNTGRRQVLSLPMERQVRQAVVAWLDGIRLARLRILDVFAAHGISPIPTVGHPFDPRYHIAVATDNSRRAPDGVIVSQDRAGYATASTVLREAEVVVARADK
ncbi:MAG: nucleotide exchange factor GrpE [Anaerolineae bacterium]|nr:nucleotide exchange factor GrpE [Anaerolineae bacterium]